VPARNGAISAKALALQVSRLAVDDEKGAFFMGILRKMKTRKLLKELGSPDEI